MVDVKKLREEKNITQDELARRCDVGRTTITNIETGYATPSVNLAKKMGDVLDVPWSNFFD